MACALQNSRGTGIDWNQSREFALLAFTPQGERLCGLAEICRPTDYRDGNNPIVLHLM